MKQGIVIRFGCKARYLDKKFTGFGARLGRSNILTLFVQAAARKLLSGEISIRLMICFKKESEILEILDFFHALSVLSVEYS